MMGSWEILFFDVLRFFSFYSKFSKPYDFGCCFQASAKNIDEHKLPFQGAERFVGAERFFSGSRNMCKSCALSHYPRIAIDSYCEPRKTAMAGSTFPFVSGLKPVCFCSWK
jgi:hypothetical protein